MYLKCAAQHRGTQCPRQLLPCGHKLCCPGGSCSAGVCRWPHRGGGRLGCSDHEMDEFRILRGGSRAISRIKTLDLRRANFGLFKELHGGIPWVRALEGRGDPRELVAV